MTASQAHTIIGQLYALGFIGCVIMIQLLIVVLSLNRK